MRATGLGWAAGSSALLFCLLASASPAQESSRQKAPVVRVYSQNGGVVSSYVTPAIEVSENAYVVAVMMDLDGHIQVLHPEFPGISIRIQSHKQLRLPNFFAGYNAPMETGARYTRNGMVGYDRDQALGNDARGSVIALASRAPFNLEMIEADGDWNIAEIRRLIEHRSPAAAAQSLARYLGAKGEPIGQDYMRFAGQRQSSYYAYDDLGYCGGAGYGYGSLGGSFYQTQAFTRAAELRSLGLRPVLVGYDACGLPVFGVEPFRRDGRFPVLPPHWNPRDTTVFPKSRMPAGFPRHSASGELTARPVPEGIFPLPQRAEAQAPDARIAAPAARRSEPQMRDVATPAPREPRPEPREISNEFRPQPVMPAFPDRTPTPVERPAPPRSEPAATGAFPVSRPEPREVIERSPPPQAAPAQREIIERSPPPAPAPRAQEAPPPPRPSRAEPASVPPPRR